MKIYFDATDIEYANPATEKKAIAFCLTLFKGTAYDWVRRQRRTAPHIFDEWTTFETTVSTAFGHLDREGRAIDRWMHLK